MHCERFVPKWAGFQLGALLLSLGATGLASANPQLRYQTDQRGDMVLLGNTTGFDCHAGGAKPLMGSAYDTEACKKESTDSSSDFFWLADSPVPGAAFAGPGVKAKDASSRAMLKLPVGATVTYARLYWAATGPTTLDPKNVGFSRPGVFTQTLTADATRGITKLDNVVPAAPPRVYQATADVTSLVKTNGPGAYQVTGIPSIELPGLNKEVVFVTWSMVVFYQNPTDPVRNLALFDGLDVVSQGNDATVSITGFSVPLAGFDAKIGIVSYEGDQKWVGDGLSFNGNALSNAQNPVDNFFNGTRSNIVWDAMLNQWKSVPVSNVGDLPELAGTPESMHGFDMDVVDVSSYLMPGQTQATFKATTKSGSGAADVYMLGVFATSISTFKPVLDGSIKSYTNETNANAGINRPLDLITYEITNIKNTGNDAAVDVEITDELPAKVTYQPGSLCVIQGMGCTPVTDAAGDDVGEYIAATRSIRVRLGQGANATTGGKIPVNDSVPGIRFQVVVNADAIGSVANQAFISADGEKSKYQGGSKPVIFGSGTPTMPNTPTVFDVTICRTNADCPDELPICDTSSEPARCVNTCKEDKDCATLPGGPYVCHPETDGQSFCRPVADLAVSVTSSESTVERDESTGAWAQHITYTVKPTNLGPAPAPGATVTYPIPPQTTVVEVDGGVSWTCDVQAMQVVCTSSQALGLGDTSEIRIHVVVEIGGSTQPFQVRIDPVGILDLTLGNNEASLTTPLQSLDLAGGGFGCSAQTGGTQSGTLIELGVWLAIFGVCVVILAWRTARIQRVRDSA